MLIFQSWISCYSNGTRNENGVGGATERVKKFGGDEMFREVKVFRDLKLFGDSGWLKMLGDYGENERV